MPGRGRETEAQRERRERIAASRKEDKRRVWQVQLSDAAGPSAVTVDVDNAKTGCSNEMASQVQISVEAGKGTRSFEATVYHSCSQWPACGSPNQYYWEENGHNMELAVDGTALHVWKEAMVLFQDGRDVETGRTRTQYWRRVFLKKLVVASILVSLGAIGLIVYLVTNKSLVSMILVLIPFGVVYGLLSLAAMCRHYPGPDLPVNEDEDEANLEERPLVNRGTEA